MLNDITKRDDIILLINKFYNYVQQDALISHFFNDVAKIDWEHHLPQMYNFWDSLLFGKKVYSGNPMRKHLDLSAQVPLKHEHFEQWIKLFYQTVDQLFIGNNATKIKDYAQTIRENLEMRTCQELSSVKNKLIY